MSAMKKLPLPAMPKTTIKKIIAVTSRYLPSPVVTTPKTNP